MGTINYGTSDYITMGFKPNNIGDFTDKDRKEMAEEYGRDIDDDYLYDLCHQYDTDDYDNAKSILNKCRFYFFNIELKGGYYAGSYLDIENNFSVCYDDWKEKRAAQKEITQIRQLLLELAGIGMKSCHPGWCTSYDDYAETVEQINSAIKTMREEAKAIPTYTWFSREQYGRRQTT